jgi:hypothetical protein
LRGVRVRLRLIRDPTRSENCDAAAAPPAVLEMMSAFVLPTRPVSAPARARFGGAILARQQYYGARASARGGARGIWAW